MWGLTFIAVVLSCTLRGSKGAQASYGLWRSVPWDFFDSSSREPSDSANGADTRMSSDSRATEPTAPNDVGNNAIPELNALETEHLYVPSPVQQGRIQQRSPPRRHLALAETGRAPGRWSPSMQKTRAANMMGTNFDDEDAFPVQQQFSGVAPGERPPTPFWAQPRAEEKPPTPFWAQPAAKSPKVRLTQVGTALSSGSRTLQNSRSNAQAASETKAGGSSASSLLSQIRASAKAKAQAGLLKGHSMDSYESYAGEEGELMGNFESASLVKLGAKAKSEDEIKGDKTIQQEQDKLAKEQARARDAFARLKAATYHSSNMTAYRVQETERLKTAARREELLADANTYKAQVTKKDAMESQNKANLFATMHVAGATADRDRALRYQADRQYQQDMAAIAKLEADAQRIKMEELQQLRQEELARHQQHEKMVENVSRTLLEAGEAALPDAVAKLHQWTDRRAPPRAEQMQRKAEFRSFVQAADAVASGAAFGNPITPLASSAASYYTGLAPQVNMMQTNAADPITSGNMQTVGLQPNDGAANVLGTMQDPTSEPTGGCGGGFGCLHGKDKAALLAGAQQESDPTSAPTGGCGGDFGCVHDKEKTMSLIQHDNKEVADTPKSRQTDPTSEPTGGCGGDFGCLHGEGKALKLINTQQDPTSAPTGGCGGDFGCLHRRQAGNTQTEADPTTAPTGGCGGDFGCLHGEGKALNLINTQQDPTTAPTGGCGGDFGCLHGKQAGLNQAKADPTSAPTGGCGGDFGCLHAKEKATSLAQAGADPTSAPTGGCGGDFGCLHAKEKAASLAQAGADPTSAPTGGCGGDFGCLHAKDKKALNLIGTKPDPTSAPSGGGCGGDFGCLHNKASADPTPEPTGGCGGGFGCLHEKTNLISVQADPTPEPTGGCGGDFGCLKGRTAGASQSANIGEHGSPAMSMVQATSAVRATSSAKATSAVQSEGSSAQRETKTVDFFSGDAAPIAPVENDIPSAVDYLSSGAPRGCTGSNCSEPALEPTNQGRGFSLAQRFAETNGDATRQWPTYMGGGAMPQPVGVPPPMGLPQPVGVPQPVGFPPQPVAMPVARPASAHCTPQCTWRCQSPKCNEVCEPICQSPVCQTRCSSYDLSACRMNCDKPSCSVVCPQKLCAAASCPMCTTQCSEPKCNLQCPQRQPCRNICENPRCEWRCKAPESCPKPQCEMVCETPTNCMSSTYRQLPPLMPGETAVQSFSAPSSLGSTTIAPTSLLQESSVAHHAAHHTSNHSTKVHTIPVKVQKARQVDGVVYTHHDIVHLPVDRPTEKQHQQAS